jgi:hypothetical protein
MSSPVIAFASVFLSLVFGPQQVEVVVSEEVAGVELHLDGQLVDTLTAPSWSTLIDLGSKLQPHHLEAIAFDDQKKELARTEQWINLPTSPAHVSMVIERDEKGTAMARLAWAHFTRATPQSFELAFDGQPVTVDDPERIPLPAHDPEQLHFLRAEVFFEQGVSAVAEVTFGGSYGDELNTELTALPVLLEKTAALPKPEFLQRWFRSPGGPLTVAAVDRGPAEVLLIRDEMVQGTLERIAAARAVRGSGAGLNRTLYANRFDARLGTNQNLGFFWPFMTQSSSGIWVFPPTYGWMSPRDGGVGFWLANTPPPAAPPNGQLLTDAVAVAGLSSLARNRRRAVVLILGKEPADSSRLTATICREYLRSIRVPLFVWSPFKHPDSPWGEVVDISSMGRLRTAVGELSRALDRQRVVWLQGRHLPQKISLTDEATGIRLPL